MIIHYDNKLKMIEYKEIEIKKLIESNNSLCHPEWKQMLLVLLHNRLRAEKLNDQ